MPPATMMVAVALAELTNRLERLLGKSQLTKYAPALPAVALLIALLPAITTYGSYFGDWAMREESYQAFNVDKAVAGRMVGDSGIWRTADGEVFLTSAFYDTGGFSGSSHPPPVPLGCGSFTRSGFASSRKPCPVLDLVL